MACHKLGFFLENGVGCKKDIERSIEYYQKAYEQGTKKKKNYFSRDKLF